MFDSYISRPASPIPPDDEDEDIWFPAEEGSDDAWSRSSPPPASPVRVEDDTCSNGGVNSSSISISTSRHYALFPRGAFERPKDPDMLQPVSDPDTSQPVSSPPEEPIRKVIMPRRHPLYAHALRKRESENDADDERPHKRLRPQLARRTHPLPKLVKYRLHPKAPKSKTPKIDEETRTKTDPGVPARRPLTPDPPGYDAILEHLAFCSRRDAKRPTYAPIPFPLGEIGAVHSFRKKYRPIDMTKT
ncbi:hypothetical protein EDB92DRAFT_1812853 [Lactarius akahatsu]|uniref:Uncharacterized protein n=1 Tax=Lactarius akahatsu TaxID=416441 RepID=A0AAD4LPX9_9AGAM|nr:hypothetical protein EDB92DRAFT_1812853 [Lactarius akahatsu]